MQTTELPLRFMHKDQSVDMTKYNSLENLELHYSLHVPHSTYVPIFTFNTY